ncbi:MAG: peptide chain release factor 2 [Leptonema sp. (in: Bacteria)]|nr:peptide chain release factor 2 [Leptonema sp. (in: bacteria)]
MADLKATEIYIYHNQHELEKDSRDFKDQFLKHWSKNKIDALRDELADMEHRMSQSDFWNDADVARDISRQKSALEKKTQPWVELKAEVDDFADLIVLTIEELGQSEGLQSLSKDFNRMNQKFEDLQLAEALLGEDDGRNAIITISSGAGGTESQDWTSMLFRMYSRWFDKNDYDAAILDIQEGEEAGLKTVSLLVKGENAFGYLKGENGIHRLVRISPFDSNKRRHTSFASVHVAPELDDSVNVNIEDKDIRIDTYRASGAGGQHINKTDSAVRITHIPTGIVVQCQNERSQHKNKDQAMKMLKARLYEIEKAKQESEAETKAGEKRDVAWGSQIRSYVMHPYKMVKDLRTGEQTSDVDSVMDGELDPFVNSYLKNLSAGTLGKATDIDDDD